MASVSPSRARTMISVLLLSILVASASIRCTAGDSELPRLFREEMQQASARLHWRGEALSDNTVYAIALTGLSWESGWGRERLFSLAETEPNRGKPAKVTPDRRLAQDAAEVRDAFNRRDYRQAVRAANAHFSLDEISRDPDLKEWVGLSLMQLNQPEQAFPLFVSQFDPPRSGSVPELNRKFRVMALESAQRAGLRREAIVFGLSLLLEPGTSPRKLDEKMLRTLEDQGVDIERVMIGILEAPERLRGLPAYYYAAADILTARANPRLLPFMAHLAVSDDGYLRSRALISLGAIAYRGRPTDPQGWASATNPLQLRESGISAGQRTMIAQALEAGAKSDRFRVRAGAALGLALAGDDADLDLLLRLSQDKAYILTAADGARARVLSFPVRVAANVGLARFGRAVDLPAGPMTGKDLERARRGGRDESGSRGGLRRDTAGGLEISALDSIVVPPVETQSR